MCCVFIDYTATKFTVKTIIGFRLLRASFTPPPPFAAASLNNEPLLVGSDE